jgi:hypothetical protein
MFGNYVIMGATGSANKHGYYANMDQSSAYTSEVYGFYSDLNTSGAQDNYGLYNLMSNSFSAASYGVYNEFDDVNGSGFKYGMYNDIQNVQGIKYGVKNDATGTANGTFYGFENDIPNAYPSVIYGLRNFVNNPQSVVYGTFNDFNGAAGGTLYGNYTSINNTDPSSKYGVFNTMSSNSTAALFGTYNFISSVGTGIHYGTFNNVFGDGNYAVYGTNSANAGWAGYFIGNTYMDGNTIVNESGTVDHDFRAESDTRVNALLVDAGLDAVVIGDPTPFLSGNGAVVNGITVDYVADMDNGLATGTAIGVGSIEYILDANSETTINNRFSPAQDNIYDLGSATLRWDDVYATNGTIITSDQREKKDIKDLEGYGLDAVMALRPVTYKWKDQQNGETVIPENLQETKIGLIAQEVQAIIPEVVVSHDWKVLSEEEPNKYDLVENERLGMSYHELVPVLIKAIQEQQEEIEALSSNNISIGPAVIQDFGSIDKEGETIKVIFSESFANQLPEGTVPVITITSLEEGARYSVIRKDANGFEVKREGGEGALKFDWTAISKVK